MGLFDKRNHQEALPNDWINMTKAEQLGLAIEQSFELPVVLFKHSIRCGISSGAKYALEEDWDFASEELAFYYLDLINHRPISNAIADELNVIHQSPQIIVLRNGQVVHTATHHAINASNLKEALLAAR